MAEKILVVRYRFIGDMILTVPFLRNLRNNFPDAQIDMLVAPNSYEVISECPYVNNFIIFDTKNKHRYETSGNKKKSFFSYVKELKENKYSRAYVLKRSLSSALLCFLAKIPYRIGFDTEGRGLLLSKRVKYDTQKHESRCFLDVLRAEGKKVDDGHLENWVSDDLLSKIDNLLSENDISKEEKKVVVHATATNPKKLWSSDNFAHLIKMLDERNIRIIHVGAPSDRAAYEEIYKKTGELKKKPLNLCGKLTLRESLALIKRADLIVGNDSGNLHMASSVGTKVVGIYGAMPVSKWGALGEGNKLLTSNVPCAPCNKRGKCTHNLECLSAITPQMVMSAIEEILKI
ncbi:lipopolysaccharide heptosyltransferase II [bacterium]|nr:lipopolysaccharide heptosyltransferase II [bacterium]